MTPSTPFRPEVFALLVALAILTAGVVAVAALTRRRPPHPALGEPSGPGYKIVVGLWVFCGVLCVIGAALFASGQHFSYFVGMIGNTLVIAGLPTLIRFVWINRRLFGEAIQYAHEATPVPAPPPPPVPSPAPAPVPAAGPTRPVPAWWLVLPVLLVAVIGVVLTSTAGTNGRIGVQRVDFLMIGALVALAILTIARRRESAGVRPAAGPRPARFTVFNGLLFTGWLLILAAATEKWDGRWQHQEFILLLGAAALWAVVVFGVRAAYRFVSSAARRSGRSVWAVAAEIVIAFLSGAFLLALTAIWAFRSMPVAGNGNPASAGVFLLGAPSIFLLLILPVTVIGATLYVIFKVIRHPGPAGATPVAPAAPAPWPPKPCPKCAAPVAADAPLGLCPKCLMQAALFSNVVDPNRTSPYRGPATAPDPQDVQEFFPQLEILGLVGQGGMGAVYKARQPNLDRIVALKLIRPHGDDPTFAERFAREAKAMARLAHPNIVAVHETGEVGGSLFLLMEYVDGVTLRDAMRAKALTPAQSLQVVGQVCHALQFAHEQGVVHRDIKPENILLDKSGKVKIADFGLAKVADADGVSLTRTHQAMGTPHYMAPEQWERPSEVDHRADMFALGVVIYELLTGELPLGRFDPPSKKVQIDVRLDEVVLRLLEKEPGRRYQHASDVWTAIEGIGRRPYRAAARTDGWEYRSKTTVWGWPLVHIVRGIDPATGQPPWAKGVIAVGPRAIGGVAVGGLAVGGVSVGGASVGVFALGGGATGLVAVGGVALGLLAAAGGLAVGGLFAAGGLAVGYFAVGGTAIGAHVFGPMRPDPQAFFQEIREFVRGAAEWVGELL